jgi:hypothetical protein
MGLWLGRRLFPARLGLRLTFAPRRRRRLGPDRLDDLAAVLADDPALLDAEQRLKLGAPCLRLAAAVRPPAAKHGFEIGAKDIEHARSEGIPFRGDKGSEPRFQLRRQGPDQ